MKIFDCFLYNGENFILDIRLNILSKIIDKFVIVESKYDHQGNKKKLRLNLDNFSSFKDKIIYLVIDRFPENLTNWQRENFQRNYLINGLYEADENDYIIISDIDEIPNLSRLDTLIEHKYSVFEQRMFYYKFNLLNKTNPYWYGSRICKKKFLKTPQWLRDQKIKKYPFWQFNKIKWNIIKNGGWHFSFLMKPNEIQKKIKSFAHDEYNKNEFLEIENIEKKIISGNDLFNRNQNYKTVDLDDTFPKYILDNKKKYNEWII